MASEAHRRNHRIRFLEEATRPAEGRQQVVQLRTYSPAGGPSHRPQRHLSPSSVKRSLVHGPAGGANPLGKPGRVSLSAVTLSGLRWRGVVGPPWKLIDQSHDLRV